MKKLAIFILAVVILSGCRLMRPDIMLKTPKDYVYSPVKDSASIRESRISANDILEFRLFSNDGFKLIDLTSANTTLTTTGQSSIQYVVENDGTVKLPVLGNMKVSGFTIREAENFLEEKYTQYYVKPFVLMKITNKRVIIFPGTGNDARVITITNNHTTLIEVIAQAGGLPAYAKAYKIKVIRGNPESPTVYLIDLSTISGIAQGSMVVQANDIIYVEPRIRVLYEVTKELEPILALVNSTLLLYTVYISVKR